jgi:hypothetical protein
MPRRYRLMAADVHEVPFDAVLADSVQPTRRAVQVCAVPHFALQWGVIRKREEPAPEI